MNFIPANKMGTYLTATIRPAAGDDRGLMVSMSVKGKGKAAPFVSIRGNLHNMEDVTTITEWLATISPEHFETTPKANLMAPPAGLMAPPPVTDTVPCHEAWNIGDIIKTDDGDYRVVAKGVAARI